MLKKTTAEKKTPPPSNFHWGTFEAVPAGHRLDIIEEQDPRMASQDVTVRLADYYFVCVCVCVCVCVYFTIPDVKYSLKFHNMALLWHLIIHISSEFIIWILLILLGKGRNISVPRHDALF